MWKDDHIVVEGKGKEAVVADLMALFRSARISCVLAEL